MAFVKKTWKDRVVQYANRRLLTKSGGEIEQVVVTRDEGTVTEAGDKFDAATMNDLEDRLEYAFDNVSTAIECTQAEYDTWKNAGQLKPQTSYIITDAPNLNATASDIEYSSGVTVKQAIDSKENKFKSGDSFSLSGSYFCGQVSNNRYRFIFTIPLSKSAVGLTATLSGLSFALIGGGNYNTVPTGMTVTPAVDSITEVGLNCTLFFSADWTSLVNDDIFLIRLISGTVTFS